jgi:hypothetical protein
MALVIADRVQETSTTSGTGTLTLLGAVTGYQSFAAVGNANTTYYTIADPTNGDWEVGIGTYTASGTTLSRDTVLASSNSGALVNFSSDVKSVFVTYPANKSVYQDAAGNVGIGTDSPGAKLHVDSGRIRVSNSGGGEGGELQLMNPNGTDVGMSVDVSVADIGRIFSVRNNFQMLIGQLGGTGGIISLCTAATERARVAADGSQSSVIPGGSTLYPEFKCRAWVNFNGTGTVAIRASGNVSSITDNGTGNYTVNFTTAMPDANYASAFGGRRTSGASSGYQTTCENHTSSNARLYTFSTSGSADWDYVEASFFR